MRKDDLFDLHFKPGMAIRNAFGLYDSGKKLLASYGFVHPGNASGAGVIINKLWARLKHGD